MRDDAREVASALSGTREGYRALFDRHRPVVERAIAAWAELDDAEAADLVLDVFARVFGRLANLKEPARFGPWLLIAARQRCRSRLARKRDAEAIAADLGAAPQIDLAPDPGPGGLDLGRILAALPEGPEREAPRLFFIEGKLTARQIADRLRLSPETVTRHLERVRGRAKAQLAARLLERRAAAAAEGGASAPEHLDAKVWRYVIHGERFPGERGFATHLCAPCAACDRFLLGLQDADGLDGDVDAALLGERTSPVAKGDTAFEQAMRRLHLHLRVSGRAGPGTGRPQPGKLVPLATAGALALAGLVVLTLQHSRRQEMRAVSEGPEVSLSLEIAAPGGSRDGGEASAAGVTYGEDRVVYLHYELTGAAFVTLLRVAPDGKTEVLTQQGRLGSGRHELSVNGMPAGVSLRGFAGTNRFYAVATPTPISPEALLAIFSAFPESAASAPALESAGVARVDLEVAAAGE